MNIHKFLGIYVDENLNWKEHVNLIANRVFKSIGIISKARFYLSMPSLRTLYFALVYPYLQYATTVWGSTYKTTLNRPLVLQKRIRRVNTKSCFDAPSAPLFYKHNFLSWIPLHGAKKGIDIVRYLVSELRWNCPAPLFMTTKWARVAVLRRFRTSPRGANDNDAHACEPNYSTLQNRIIAKILPVNKFTTLKFWSLLPSMNG